jgi:hypothetical protein
LSGSDSWLGNAWQSQALEMKQAPDFRGFFLFMAAGFGNS